MDPIRNTAAAMPAQASAAASPPVGLEPEAAEAEAAPPPAAQAGWVVSSWRKMLVQSLGVGLCYAIVLVFFSVKLDNFFTTANVETILDGAALLGIVAVGQTYLIVGGGFDLSVGGVVPLGAVVFGSLLGRFGLVPAMLLTVVVGAGVGLVTGLIVTYGKINALIPTLGMLSIAGGAAYIVADGQTNELTAPSAGFWGTSAPLGLQTGTWGFVGL